MTRKIVCLPCRGKGLFDTGIAILKCNWCKGTGSISEIVYEFTLVELKAFYRILKHQYVDYQDIEATDAVNKMMKYIKMSDK